MSDVKPALTPEQWAATPKVYFREPTSRYPGGPVVEETSYGVELVANNGLAVWDDSWGLTVGATERHALAAVALHGQPFGFTHEDVALLESLHGSTYATDELHSLIDRIAALLPPKA